MINEADESAPRKLGEYTLITDGNTYNGASVSCESSRGTSQTHTCRHLPPSLCVAPHLFAYNGASASCASLRAHHRHTPDRDFSISSMDAPIRRVNSRSRTAAHTLVMGGAMSNDARAMVSSSPSSPCSTGSKCTAKRLAGRAALSPSSCKASKSVQQRPTRLSLQSSSFGDGLKIRRKSLEIHQKLF